MSPIRGKAGDPDTLHLLRCFSSCLLGFASILVVIGHFLLYWIKDSPWPVFGVEFLSPVSLFFVISGFTFTVIYGGDKSAQALLTRTGFVAFLRKRVARLAPVYYTGLAIGIAPLILYEAYSTTNLVLNVVFASTMLQSVTLQGLGWDGPLWTVSAFVVCYLAFPVLLKWLRPLSQPILWRWYWALTILCAASSAGVLTGICHFFFAWRVPQFTLGIVAGLIATRSPPLLRPILSTELCTAGLALNFCGAAIVAALSGAISWQVYMTVMEFVVTGLQGVRVVCAASLPVVGVARAPPHFLETLLICSGGLSASRPRCL